MTNWKVENTDTIKLIEWIHTNVVEAKDNLMLAKVFQVDQANKRQGPEEIYKVNDLVLQLTASWRKEYMAAGSGHITKLLPEGMGHTMWSQPFQKTQPIIWRCQIPHQTSAIPSTCCN